MDTLESFRFAAVLCHTCGSLFSGGNPNCKEFDAQEPSQQDFCKQGEACLWYSWQKSDTETSVIRECFSPSILLGPINDPLTLSDTCRPKDISETPGASIMACLCNTPLCNAINIGSGPVALPQVAPKRPKSPPRNRNPAPRDRNPPPQNRNPPPRDRNPPPRDRNPSPRDRNPPPRSSLPQRTQSSNNIEEDLSREELAALAQFGSINNQRTPNTESELPRTRFPQENNRNTIPAPVFDPNKEVLRKYPI